MAGTTFFATLVYDDTVLDSNPSTNAGDYAVPAASSDLSLTTKTFTFTPGSTSALGIAIDDDNAFGEDVVFLFADAYTASGLPAGVSLGGTRFANPTLTDTSATAHSSDALTGLPWAIGDYDLTSFFFTAGVLGPGLGSGKKITLQGTITGLAVLPEPSTLALGAIGCLGLLGARLRG